MENTKKWFWILLNAFLVVIIVVIVFVAAPAITRYASSFASARTLTVTAQGQTTATPDLAELSFAVVTRGQNPKTIGSVNDETMNSVMQFLKQQNIATSDIQTTGYNLSPIFTYDTNGNQTGVSGYTLTQQVDVKVHDLKNVASVIGGLAPLGVNQISNITFTFSDQDIYLQPARAQAFDKAKHKAQEMASAMGVSLGEAVNVSESNYVPYGKNYAAASLGMGMADAPASTPPIQPGSENLTDNVTITFALH